jgi:hypothetical protein
MTEAVVDRAFPVNWTQISRAAIAVLPNPDGVRAEKSVYPGKIVIYRRFWICHSPSTELKDHPSKCLHTDGREWNWNMMAENALLETCYRNMKRGNIHIWVRSNWRGSSEICFQIRIPFSLCGSV